MTPAPRLIRNQKPPRTRIVHFGPGAFFRAFVGTYTDDASRADVEDWGIAAVSLKSASARDALMPQGGVYTSISLAPEGIEDRLVSCVTHVLVAPEDPETVLMQLAVPNTKIVTLTITEKGYCLNMRTCALDTSAEDVQHDVANPSAPRTAIGYIVEGLARRHSAGRRPFTVLSCDNLPDNGAATRRAVIDLAHLRDPVLAAWIETEVRFPSTMVDRIAPATTKQSVSALAKRAGYFDPACVQHEPFRQWVIEDDFVDDQRPDWDVAGAQFVRSVARHEAMKLRCLNGTHSALAYLGYLAGYETIADCAADPDFVALCRKLWAEEIVPTLDPPDDTDIGAYTEALLKRYSNPAIRHQTWQIAMDGSQKLPQRLVATLLDQRARCAVAPGLCLAIAAWMRYIGGLDEQGQEIDVRDPLASELRHAADNAADPASKVTSLLGMRAVFSEELARDTVAVAEITKAYCELTSYGARACVADYVRSGS
ncbi:MAG: mannitol dehydrogenase family protein [Pseudomonadota bacterium]